jgi:hypothetical protein
MELSDEGTGEFLLVKLPDTQMTRRLSVYEFLQLYDKCLLVLILLFSLLLLGIILFFIIYSADLHKHA